MRHITRIVLGSLALAIPASVSAQSASQAAAALALTFSPSAGLTQHVTPLMAGEAQSKTSFAVRYGRISEEGTSFNNFAITGAMPVSEAATVSLTAGMRHNSIEGGESSNDIIFGLGGDMMLGQTALGEGDNAAKFVYGLNADLGYSKVKSLNDANALTGRIGAPLSLSFGAGETAKIVPYVAPSFGFGRLSAEGESESGSRFIIGAGVGVNQISERISFNVGIQKVMIENGKTLFGFGLTLQ
jgi:hypothetical protein